MVLSEVAVRGEQHRGSPSLICSAAGPPRSSHSWLLLYAVQSSAVFALDNPVGWDLPGSIRIPTAIGVSLALGLRLYGVYRSSKSTRRSPRVRRVENIVAISLWSCIVVGVIFLLLFKR